MPEQHRRAFDRPATVVGVPGFEPTQVRHMLTMLPEHAYGLYFTGVSAAAAPSPEACHRP